MVKQVIQKGTRKELKGKLTLENMDITDLLSSHSTTSRTLEQAKVPMLSLRVFESALTPGDPRNE